MRSQLCKHVPAILHRTGGPSAEDRNVCSKCGDVIYRTDKEWSIHPPAEVKEESK